jgi:2-keto-3-deoxy-L-rhamnonate aldolase RhmA
VTRNPQSLRARMEAGQSLFGTMAFFKDVAVVEIAARAGLDVVIPDMEHSGADGGTIEDFARACDASGVEALVRVRGDLDSDVLRALEAGCSGVLFPRVVSGESAEYLGGLCRYPPAGTRGTCRLTRSAGYGEAAHEWREHTARQDKRVIVGGIIECAEALGDLDTIVRAMDFVMIGRADLAAELGVPGELDHMVVHDAVSHIERACRRQHKPMGVMCYSSEEGASWLNRGYRLVIYAADGWVLRQAYSEWLSEVTSSPSGNAAPDVAGSDV